MLFPCVVTLSVCLSVSYSGGQAGGPCPLEDSWVFNSSNNLWSRLPSCTLPALSSSLAPLNLQVSDIAVLYGGTQKGPGALSQVRRGECEDEKEKESE